MSSSMHDEVRLALEHQLPIDGLRLPLRRYATRGAGDKSVLLLHGGNTNSRMYHEPDGGLVKYLAEAGCDVWTLDWRASASVLGPLMSRGPLKDDVEKERSLFTLDRVAEQEIPQALEYMRANGAKGSISVMGFCLGGGALSMAVARGHLERCNVGNVVLVTMGLFYEVPWNGWIKAEDFIIERMLSTAPTYRAVDPANAKKWPKPLADAYDHWPKPWLPTGDEPVDELFRRLTFMYGEPYARGRLPPAFERGLDEDFFGPIHVGLYLHASQLVRRGYAAKFNSLDVIDRSRIQADSQPVAGHDLNPTYFRNKRVTVFSGAEDRLWHRDSMDLMYEWLRNEAVNRRPADARFERERHRKHVLPHYGHLDLYWGDNARKDVYGLFAAALTQPPSKPAPAGLGLSRAHRPSQPAQAPPDIGASASAAPLGLESGSG